ncbi:hypothetical protein THAOC_07674, partial [Thalassiosira oceanica]
MSAAAAAESAPASPGKGGGGAAGTRRWCGERRAKTSQSSRRGSQEAPFRPILTAVEVPPRHDEVTASQDRSGNVMQSRADGFQQRRFSRPKGVMDATINSLKRAEKILQHGEGSQRDAGATGAEGGGSTFLHTSGAYGLHR